MAANDLPASQPRPIAETDRLQAVAAAVLGPVLQKRPLEYFLPASDGLLGKLCNVVPGIFLSQLASARKRGRKNFSSDAF